MKYCQKCGVNIAGDLRRCPLCQGDLSGTPEEEAVFPGVPKPRPHKRLLIRLFALATVVAAIVCLSINAALPGQKPWSAFVVAGLFCVWLTVSIAYKKRGNPMKLVFFQICALSVLALIWDRCTGFYGWSVDFVLPISYACMIVTQFVLAWSLHLKPQECLLYLLLSVLIGFLPLVLLLCRVLRVTVPSIVCTAVSGAFLAVLLLFNASALKNELIRRLHL